MGIKNNEMIKEKSVQDTEGFKLLLKTKNMKATPQRLAVHEAMTSLGHASADMVAQHMMEKTGTKFSIASVYNTLSTFADHNIYDRRLSANNKMYFDVNNFKHVHLYDSENHEYRDVIDDEIIGIVENHFKRRKFRGMKVCGVDIQIICKPSRRKKSL